MRRAAALCGLRPQPAAAARPRTAGARTLARPFTLGPQREQVAGGFPAARADQRGAAGDASRPHPRSPRAERLASALRISPREAAAMLHSFRPLASYNPATLEDKALSLGCALGATPRQAGAILARAPRALGASEPAIAERLDALALALLPPAEADIWWRSGHGAAGDGDPAGGLRRLVMRLPWLLTLSPAHLQTRLDALSSGLNASPAEVAAAVRRHPRLLQSCNQLPEKLRAIEELLQTDEEQPGAGDRGGTAAPEGGGGATPEGGGGAKAPLPPTGAARAGPGGHARAPAAEMALLHPWLLCYSPRALRAAFCSLIESSGLPAAAVSASLRSQPELLEDAARRRGE